MIKTNKTILFDIDHTIFDTILYRKNLYANLAKNLGFDIEEFSNIAKREYDKLRKKTYYLEPDIFLKTLLIHTKKPADFERMQSVFWDKKLYESCIYPDVKKTFSYLSKNAIEIGIFSTGDVLHQKIKIDSLKEYLVENHIYISPDKLKIIKDTFAVYRHLKAYMIDDYPKILHEVKKHHENVYTIWIKRDKSNDQHVIPDNFKPDATISDLDQLIDIISTDN